MNEDGVVLRGAGKILIFDQERQDILTSSIRLSYGRLLGKSRPGYLHSEILNTYELNNRLGINLNSKASFTGSGTLVNIGSSIHYTIIPNLFIIPEYNFGITNSDDNYGITISKNIFSKSKLDLKISNSEGNIDMGRMIKSKDLRYEVNIGYKF